MSATIVNVPNTRQSVTSAQKEVAVQRDALNRVSDEVSFMEDAWDSEAQRTYTDKFRTIKAEMEKFNERTDDYLNMMRKFVDDVESTDTSVAGMFTGISF